MAQSTYASGPHLTDFEVAYYPKDIIHIAGAENDSRVKDALISLDLYRGGISIDLTSVEVVENATISTVEYSFEIFNHDEEDLYVIDPDKTGTALFHYFTNGVVFQGDGVFPQSTDKEVETPAVDWDLSWFSEVPINSSIRRTVRLRGYPKIAAGNYRCYFTFANPQVEREDRSIYGGRIWIGKVNSNTIEVEVN